MSAFRRGYRTPGRRSKKWLIVLLFIIILLGVAIGLGFRWYSQSIAPANATDTQSRVLLITGGMTEDAVSEKLESDGIIRSAIAYRLYVRIHKVQGKMQAGGYELAPSMTVAEIVDVLSNGKIAVELITILPAQRLDQIKKAFSDAGYTDAEIEEALSPSAYKDHPALADKPARASLEGYLYPESFQKTPTTPLKAIVTLALDEMAKLLTPQLKADLAAQGLSPHEGIILASIVEREVGNPEDRTKVAQVFLTRYKRGIPLGSDPTALYGALLFNLDPGVSVDTPYNTRIYAGLPPGPINNISAQSLQAVAHPADTDYLFFVSGDDGKTYFSHTQAEHEALAAQHCIELCKSY